MSEQPPDQAAARRDPLRAPEPAPPPPAPPTAAALRASDADRERAMTLLRDAAADGRLTLGELTERIDAASRARTRAQLAALTGDLVPGGSIALPPAPPSTAPRKSRDWLVAVMGGTGRRGRWRVARRVKAIAAMGGVEVDLRNAELDGDDVDISAIAVMGGVDVCVPEGVDVELRGFVLMGTKDARIKGTARPGAPVVRVRALGLMGGVTVHTPYRRRAADDPGDPGV